MVAGCFDAERARHAGAVTANLLTGLGVDEYLTRMDDAGRRGLLTDALGSTIALTDDSGALLTEYTYDPFGATSVSGEASANPFQYTGREHDGATGLYFYRTRYYSPTLHRFISEDRLEVEPWETNLYAYVGNDPVSFVDPYGEATTRPMPRPLPGWAGVLVAGLAILAMLLQYLIDMLLSQLAASGSGQDAGSGQGATPAAGPSPDADAAGKDGGAGSPTPSLGRPGSGAPEFPGGEAARDEVFKGLSQGGQPFSPKGKPYPGTAVTRPDGTFVGERTSADGTPTIDLKLPGQKQIELKFPTAY